MGTSPAKKVLAAAASALLVAAVYVLRLDRAAGLVIDDAYYILLGRSLAEGGPYALVSSAAAPILPSVPPLFPAILALLFRFAPGFPDNVMLLKSVSVLAMAGAGLCTLWFAHRVRGMPAGIAWALAMATSLMPAFVFLATSTVMAECVFTLLQLAAVIAVEAAASAADGGRSNRAALLAGGLAVLTWLVRSAGVTLVAAAFARLWFSRSRTAAISFAVVVAIGAMPWLIYAQRHSPAPDDRDRYGGSIVVAYGDAIRLRVAGTTSSGRITLSELPLRAARNVMNIFGRDIGGVAAPVVYRSAAESGEEVFSLGALGFLAGSMGNAPQTIVLSLALSIVALLGYAAALRERPTVAEFLVPMTMAMLLLYPYWTYRFVLPLAPFVLTYLALGFRALASRYGAADPWRPARLFALTVVSLQAIDHAQYIRLLRNPATVHSIDWLADQQGMEDALARLQPGAAGPGSVASTNPALVYLRTGRKGVTFDGSTVKLDDWRQLGVRYVAAFQAMDVPPALAAARVLYRDPQRRWWIVDIS